MLIQIKQGQLRVISQDDLTVKWSAASEQQFCFLTANQKEVWLYESPDANQAKTKEKKRTNVAEQLTLVRFELATGDRLADVSVPGMPTKKSHRAIFQQAISTEDGQTGYLLTSIYANVDDWERKKISYRITKVGERIDWSVEFPSQGALERPGAFLWGSFGPALDGSNNRSLTPLAGQLVVSAGQLEDIVSLDSQTGNEQWRCARVWEYERSFIGPSVWRYFIGRYGFDEHDLKYLGETVESVQKKNKQESDGFIDLEYFQSLKAQLEAAKSKTEGKRGWVFAGPVVLETQNEGETKTSIFVITAQSNSPTWSNYLARPVVYELDADGDVHSMIELPRLLQKNAVVVDKDRIIWTDQSGAQVELFQREGHGGDTFVEFNRIRKDPLASKPRKAWLQQGAFYGVEQSFDNLRLRVVEGGYIDSAKSQEINYPIQLIESDGNAPVIEVRLKLPFEGEARLPKTNYSKTSNGCRALSAYLFQLSGFQVNEDWISVQFEHGEQKFVVDFEFKAELLPARSTGARK